MTEYYTDPVTPSEALQRAIATHEALYEEVTNHAKRHDQEREAARDKLREQERIAQEQTYAAIAGQSLTGEQ